MARGTLVLALLLTCGRIAWAQLSAPVSQDAHVSVDGNKFLQNHASLDAPGGLQEEEVAFDVCPQNIALQWSTEVSSSIYATPLITDLYSDGRKDIIVPSFVHYLEVLEADNGAQAVGWPAFHRSTTHASPLLYDIDLDGVQDVLLATYNGEIMFFKDTGEQLPLGLSLPRLRVKKYWFKGLNDDPNIRDPKAMGGEDAKQQQAAGGLVGGAGGLAGAGKASVKARVGSPVPPPPPPSPPPPPPRGSSPRPVTEQVARQLREYRQKMTEYRDKYSDAALKQLLAETHAVNPTFYGLLMNELKKEGLVDEEGHVRLPKTPSSASPPHTDGEGIGTQRRRLMQVGRTRAVVGGNARGRNNALGVGDPGDRQREGLRANSFGQSGSGALQARTGTRPDLTETPLGADEYDDGSGDRRRRKLMQVDEGGGEGVPDATVAGVEQGPDGTLTEEAAGSFDVFEDEQGAEIEGGDGGAGAGGGEEVAGNEDGGVMDGAYDADEAQTDLALGLGEQEHEQAGAYGQGATGKQAGGGVDDEGAGDGTGDAADGEGAEYHAALDNKEKAELGAHFEYDELGERYELDQPVDEEQEPEQETAETEEQKTQRMALINDITSGIDTSSMDDDDGVTSNWNRYEHLYTGDYEALAAARDKALNHWWQDEEFRQGQHQTDEQYVYVDAHILATPNIADIDGDGHEELVVAVSYFYDKEYYDQPAHRHELGLALDTTKYVASGVVVFDLRTRALKWSQHLDLSTDTTTFRAYAYAAPTLADVNRDGLLEIVVGTSMGFLYVLEPKTGTPLPGWPIQMGEVQGQALVMDINNDGAVEIVAGDTRGNVAAFRVSGEEVWSRHVKSLVAQAATAGDINSDGELEIVFGTSSGHVYALSGTTGADVKGFPFRTHGRVHAPALITRLLDGPSQHIIVPSFDGYLYLIDGITGCADTVDIGETSYSMVLADDLDGNGKLDLLVCTMNGNVYAFETPATYHPLKAWTSQVMGPNGMVARHDLVGVYATQASRRPRDVAGDKLQLQVQVVDKRGVFAANGSLVTKGGPYNISAVLRGVGVKEMGAGTQPVIGVADTVTAPGLYTLEVPCPRTRASATLHLEMTDGHGLTLTDEFALSFHMHFHKLLKWFVAAPLALMVAGVLVAVGGKDEEEELRGEGWGEAQRCQPPCIKHDAGD